MLKGHEIIYSVNNIVFLLSYAWLEPLNYIDLEYWITTNYVEN